MWGDNTFPCNRLLNPNLVSKIILLLIFFFIVFHNKLWWRLLYIFYIIFTILPRFRLRHQVHNDLSDDENHSSLTRPRKAFLLYWQDRDNINTQTLLVWIYCPTLVFEILAKLLLANSGSHYQKTFFTTLSPSKV